LTPPSAPSSTTSPSRRSSRAAPRARDLAEARARDHGLIVIAIVLGHREPGISAEHRISAHSPTRLARAIRLCQETPIRAVVLTGYTHTAGLSEAEQMAPEWPLADVPVLLEVAGRNTAENASRSLPIVLALGVADRVSIVTSLWHLRAPYFFAPYRAFGFELSLCPARPGRGWAHLFAEELGGLAGMPRQRRAAMDAVRLPKGPYGCSSRAASPGAARSPSCARCTPGSRGRRSPRSTATAPGDGVAADARVAAGRRVEALHRPCSSGSTAPARSTGRGRRPHITRTGPVGA
jgi:hypothetical protein